MLMNLPEDVRARILQSRREMFANTPQMRSGKGKETKKYVAKPIKPEDITPYILKLNNNDYLERIKAIDKFGIIGNKKAVKSILPLLKDKNDYVRQAAARALGRIRDNEAVKALLDVLEDKDINVKTSAIRSLGEIRDPGSIGPLIQLLINEEEKIRDHSLNALRKFKGPHAKRAMVINLIAWAKKGSTESVAEPVLWKLIALEGREVIIRALEDPEGDKKKTVRKYVELMESNIYNVSDIGKRALKDYRDRKLVFNVLAEHIKQNRKSSVSIYFIGSLKDAMGLPVLTNIVIKKENFSKFQISAAINAIGVLGANSAVDLLLEILTDDAFLAIDREIAARSIGILKDKKAGPTLLDILKNKELDKNIRIGAAIAIGELIHKEAATYLLSLIKDKNGPLLLKIAAVSALGEIGDKSFIGPIQRSMEKTHSHYKHAARIALRKIKR